MNKKVNTVLFILGGTLLNVIVIAVCFTLLFLLFVNFFVDAVPENARMWVLVFFLIASIAASFFIYRGLINFLIKKVDVEKYFDPLFVNQSLRKKGS